MREHVIYPRFIGVIFPDKGELVTAVLHENSVRSLCADFDRMLHLHLTQYVQPEWRDMLSQVNARGTFRLHSNTVVAAQADVIDLTLDDLPPLDR